MTSFCFFKILTDHSLTQMRLPQKFVRLHRETLASSVSVVLPCSHRWKLGLVVEDDKLYLKEGWPEFVKHYQLAYGHLLDFTYVGSSNFNIAIYDKTTCEIDYSPFSSPNFTNEESDSENEDMPKKCEAEDQLWMKGNRRRNQGPYNTYRHSKAVIEARRFYSEYPHFYRVIRTDKHNRYKQQLPKKFIESHVGVKSEAVTLKVGSKEWSVNIVSCNSICCFSGGWFNFLAANSLCSGDVCVFEVITKKPPLLQVSIIRNDD
ncbi:hypothetical protein CsatB_000424 [Cannabis sativa]